jgi:hypothetical protein
MAERYSSTERLASWSDELQGIMPVSPKTMLKHMLARYPGGFSALKAQATSHLPKAPLSTKPGSIQTDSGRAVDGLLEMTGRYLDLLERLQKVSASNEDVQLLLERHMRIFGPGKPPLRLVK